MPVAMRDGFGPALVTAAASAAVYDFLFFPPYFSLALQDPQDAVIVLICVATAGVVSVLAGRARQRTREAEGLATEQAALRRVATLVARAAPPEKVFAAVAAEAGHLMGCESTLLCRYDPDGEATVVGAWDAAGGRGAQCVGSRMVLEGRKAPGTPCADPSAPTIRSEVSAPISVDDRPWGVMVVATCDERLRPTVEARLAVITELVGTAISNAETKAQLIGSRARIVTTADATRRHIERDLHDGVQQHLISLALTLRTAQVAAPPEARELARRLDGVIEGLGAVIDELREICRGIHPPALVQAGLRPALKTLARRSAVPVRLDVRIAGRMPEQIEVAAYYAVAEALANTAKHAQASVVDVTVDDADNMLRVQVCDDGSGGANPATGSGLVGLRDRVEALGGQVWLTSPVGAGTTLRAAIPLPGLSATGPVPSGSTPADGADGGRQGPE
jgi:signal transduction histidine kinase